MSFYIAARAERPRQGAPTRAPLELHRKLPGYAVTPLRRAPEVARAARVREVWVKDESSRLGLPSFKILGASWATLRALDRRVGGLPSTGDVDDLRRRLSPHLPLGLAAATDGNHGRAVARVARLLGLDAHVFVPAGTARARIEAIEGEGARCTVVQGSYDDAVARSAQEAGPRCLVISDTSWPGYSDVPRWVIEGYATIFWEIDDQLGRVPDAVIVQVGVGALAAAAVNHFGGRGCALGAVEPEEAACLKASVEAGRIVTVPGPHTSIMAGLNCGTPSEVAWPTVSRGFDVYLTVGDERAKEAMRLLARDGIVAGETGAAGAAALLELASAQAAAARAALRLGPSTDVLLVCTEGATDPAAYEAVVGAAPAEDSVSSDWKKD